MKPTPSAAVRGLDGLRGTVVTTNRPTGDTETQVAVKFDDGHVVLIPEKQLILQADQTYFVPMSPADVGLKAQAATAAVGTTSTTTSTTAAALARTVDAGGEVRIPRVEERLHVGKSEVQSTVRVRKTVHEREEVVDVPLLRERVDVERVPVNRVVTVAPEVRHEGDVMIVPVLEEVLVVEKRLMLREELRITRRKDEAREPQRVTVRTEQVEVTRDEPTTTAAGATAATVGVK
jgi:uncharacterized protein (TIGR02271 family)